MRKYIFIGLIGLSLILISIPVVHIAAVALAFSFLFPPGFIIVALAIGIIGFNYYSNIRFILFLYKEKFTPILWDFLGFFVSIPLYLVTYSFLYDHSDRSFYLNRYVLYVSKLNLVLSMSLFLILVISVQINKRRQIE